MNEMMPYIEFTNRTIKSFCNNQLSSPIASIYMLHRVRVFNSKNLKNFEDMNVDPNTLRTKIAKLIDDGNVFVSMDELLNILVGKVKLLNPSKRFIVLSVDDGYLETYTTLFPILKEFNIPFIFYVSSSFPNKKIGLWWNYLNQIVCNHSEFRVLDKDYNLNTLEKKAKFYVDFRKRFLRDGQNIESEFEDIFNVEYSNLVSFYKQELINWDQIVEMSHSDLCTIGAHTDMHFGLRFSNPDEIIADIHRNVNEIRSYIGKTPYHFAYPFGTYYSVGRREFNLVRKFGFKSAVNTFSDSIFKVDKANLFSLPRIVLNND
jgi:peptidoglycan/xylan/chitin deacetylase (PgdA/CDA1 family)